jgi:light-regulated signal transduction histidine kinase (bacteriophytochrome)
LVTPQQQLAIEYATCLRCYLAQPDERTRSDAYELGRRALKQGAGIMDIIVAHDNAIARVADEDRPGIGVGETGFLLECLAPFEMAFRGFQDANETLQRLNTELERRIQDRTRALAHANAELEAFAYAVSHDLRAPLRAMDGFSKALLDDYGEQLDENGHHYLERVRAGAVRMGNLIDGILQLSRLSRRPFERVPIDISALASEVLADLRSAEPDREVEVEVEDGLHAETDLGLVRSVLQNLLSNAYKFTSKTESPRIRFGAVEQDGVPVYFVADNGAGFDMAHADKLFHPFHRLHRESEFPGDGVGLATVARAIHRHGGVIWAHGAVNEGATFHFSLTPGAHPPVAAATGEDVIPIWEPTGRDEGL